MNNNDESGEDLPVARLSLGKDYVIRRRDVKVWNQSTSQYESGTGLPSVGFLAAVRGGPAIHSTLSNIGVEGATEDFSAVILGTALRAQLAAEYAYKVIYDRMTIGTSDTDDVPVLVVPSSEPE